MTLKEAIDETAKAELRELDYKQGIGVSTLSGKLLFKLEVFPHLYREAVETLDRIWDEKGLRGRG